MARQRAAAERIDAVPETFDRAEGRDEDRELRRLGCVAADELREEGRGEQQQLGIADPDRETAAEQPQRGRRRRPRRHRAVAVATDVDRRAATAPRLDPQIQQIGDAGIAQHVERAGDREQQCRQPRRRCRENADHRGKTPRHRRKAASHPEIDAARQDVQHVRSGRSAEQEDGGDEQPPGVDGHGVRSDDAAPVCHPIMAEPRPAGLAEDHQQCREQVLQDVYRADDPDRAPEALRAPGDVERREDQERPPDHRAP